MSAFLDAIADLSQPETAAAEIQRLNDRLSTEQAITADIGDAVRELVAGVDQTNLRRWEAIDPHHAVIVLHSAVSAQRALEDPDSSAARDQLRIALETLVPDAGEGTAGDLEPARLVDTSTGEVTFSFLAYGRDVAMLVVVCREH